jgi:AraC family transcriptional regulator
MVNHAGIAKPLRIAPKGTDSAYLVSAATPWAGMPFEAHRAQSFEGTGETAGVAGQCGVVVYLDGNVDIFMRHHGHEVCVPAPSGTAFLVSGQDRPDFARLNGTADVGAVLFPNEWFQRLSLDAAPPMFERTQMLGRDVTVSSLVRAMRDEVSRGAVTGRLYADSLSLALLTYIVEREPPRVALVRGHLSETECRRLRRHVRDRLGEDLSLADLAAQVGRRPRHFSTLFRRAFGAPPHRYVLRQRLAESARLLANGDEDIAGIAFRLGFSSQSHFAAAFRSAFGVTPRQYARGKRA